VVPGKLASTKCSCHTHAPKEPFPLWVTKITVFVFLSVCRGLCFHSPVMTTEGVPIAASELKHQYRENYNNAALKKSRKTNRDSSRNSAPPKPKTSTDLHKVDIPSTPTNITKRKSHPSPNGHTQLSDVQHRHDQWKKVNMSTNDLRVRAPTSDAASHIERFNIAMMPYNVSRIVSDADDIPTTPRKGITPKTSKSSMTANPRSNPLALRKGRNQNSKSFDATPHSYHFADADAADSKPKRSSNLFAMLLSKRTPSTEKIRPQRPTASYIGVALEDNVSFTAVDIKGDKIVVPTILDQCWMEVRRRGKLLTFGMNRQMERSYNNFFIGLLFRFRSRGYLSY
jgi:hypothetical protein